LTSAAATTAVTTVSAAAYNSYKNNQSKNITKLLRGTKHGEQLHVIAW
jgi:hypothetical protein